MMKSLFCIMVSILFSRGYTHPTRHYQQLYEPTKENTANNPIQRLFLTSELNQNKFLSSKRSNKEDLDLKAILEKSDNWSPEFVRMLKNMKEEGRSIKLKSEQDNDFDSPHTLNSVICKMEPYNTCYHVAPNGDILLSLVQQRPMRLLRIY